MHCSVARTLNLIGDPWTPLILRDLLAGLTRFDQIAEDLGISRNLLTQRLEHLMRGGVVVRTAYQQHPPRYDYALTMAGLDLAPVIMALVAWGDRWVTPEGGPPIVFEHDCGETITPVMMCPACGRPATAHSVRAHPGPGARVAPGTAVIALIAP